jgi:hypothetical protein
MSTKRWNVLLDGQTHEVVIKHGYFNARRQIFVDGTRILDLRPNPLRALRLWNTATDHLFTVAGHPCSIRIDPTIDNATYKKQLVVDGHDVESGAAVALLPETSVGVHEGEWLAGYGGFLVQPFAMAAIVLGGVASQSTRQPIWYVAGFIGAGICWGATRLVGPDARRKLLLCVVVVAILFVLPRV